MNQGKISSVSLVILMSVAILPAAALAQGSGSTGVPSTGGYSTGGSSFAVTRSVTGKVEKIAKDGFVLLDAKSGESFAVKVNEKTKYKADKKTELSGKKNLSLSDFRTGQTVRIRYRETDGTVTEVRLKRVKEEKMKEEMHEEMHEKMS